MALENVKTAVDNVYQALGGNEGGIERGSSIISGIRKAMKKMAASAELKGGGEESRGSATSGESRNGEKIWPEMKISVISTCIM